MKVLVRHLLKKTRAGGYAQRDETVEAPSIRFGRGADCEVHLSDPRLLLHHAEMTERPAGLYIEAAGSVDFQINGQLTSAATAKPGDLVQLGPYDLEILEPTDGHSAAFSMEYARPLGDELAALKARSNTTLTRMGLGIRGWAWLMFLLVVGIGIAAPLASFYTTPRSDDPMMAAGEQSILARADEIWVSGPFSGVHAHFGDNCQACHVNAFEQVTNDVCTACHDDAGHHADPVAFPVASLEGQQCEACHKEHTGGEDLVISGEAFCVSCHSQLTTVAPDSRLIDVSGFETHPEFHPTVMTGHDPITFDRVSMAADPPPVDLSNLKFPHAKHLREEGFKTANGAVVLGCVDCHEPETGGIAMLPVRFQDNCAGCHRLAFEENAPDRIMPHGDTALAKQYVEDAYASFALRGGFGDPDAADTPPVVRRLIGTPIASDEDREEALAWAQARAAEVLDGRFGRAQCGQCHTIQDGETPRDWDVVPAVLTKRWLPKGYFTHAAHEDRDCATCHAAKDSNQASDVLLPTISVCQDCHGGEFASGKTRTECTACHGFHREDLMSPDGMAAGLTSAGIVWE